MTLGTTPPVYDYVENGVSLVHAIPFEFGAAADIACSRILNGVETVLTLGAHYTVSGGGGASGFATGSVTKTSGGVDGTIFRIKRQTARGQATDLTPGDALPAETLEHSLDRQAAVAQEQDVRIADVERRAVRVAPGDVAPQLPAKAAMAGKFLAGDASGNLVPASGTGSDGSLRPDLAAPTGANLINGRIPGGSSVARVLSDKLADVVSLRDYGAALNGIADDGPAFAKLFADRPGGECRVIVDGYCRINGTVTPPAGMSNVTLDFESGGYLYNPSHGFDFLNLPVTVSGWRLVRPRFFTDTGAAGGAGRYFLVNLSNDLTAIDLWARNCWSGIINYGGKVSLLGRTYVNAIKPGSGVAVAIDMGANELCWVEDLYAENAAGHDCLAGVEILSGGSIILGGTAAKCGTPLLVAPTLGQVVATLGLWPFFNGDTSSGNGASFAGGGVIQRVEGVLRVSSNAGHGLVVTNAPRSADLLARAVANLSHGVTLASGGPQYGSRYRVAAFGNGLSGFNAEPNCTNFSADVLGGSGDDFGGNAQYSAAIGTGCDHFDLNVRGTGDTLGLLFNGAGTSATKVVTTRN